MKNRIKKIRRELNLTQQEFADKLGVSRNNIASYETGKSNVGDTAFSLICKTFNIREEWLREGTGEMFNKVSLDDEIATWVGSIQMKDGENFKKRFIAMLSHMSDTEWEILEKKALEIVGEKKED